MTQQLTPNQTQWIKALRNPRYKQTTACLRNENGFCCLGVAANEFLTDDIKVVEYNDLSDHHSSSPKQKAWSYDGQKCFAPYYVVKALSLRSDVGSCQSFDSPTRSLTDLNDCGYTFSEIADLVETNPEYYFEDESA
jgi:hypothetical protein|tara:strand:- start:79 stop:489 length:411 start_codon:yes stop_codon:yes gene_type:complete